MSANSYSMQLRSQQRQKLTHSGRDFVINGGYVEQPISNSRSRSPPRSTTIFLDHSPTMQQLDTPKSNSNAIRTIFVVGAIFMVFQMFCFQCAYIINE